MQSVVFTGPAYDALGQPVMRAELIAACQSTGRFKVQSAVNCTTDFLVASRSDTVKAKKAADLGVAVVSYAQFIAQELKGVDLKCGVRPESFSKYVDQNLLIPDFTQGLAPEDLL